MVNLYICKLGEPPIYAYFNREKKMLNQWNSLMVWVASIKTCNHFSDQRWGFDPIYLRRKNVCSVNPKKNRFLKENSDQRKRIAHFEPLFWFVISLRYQICNSLFWSFLQSCIRLYLAIPIPFVHALLATARHCPSAARHGIVAFLRRSRTLPEERLE